MMGPLSLFLVIQFILSSFLAFGAASLIAQMAISLFRVKGGRIRSFLRGIPFLYICFDVRLGTWLNPISCTSCLQKLVVYFLPKEAANLSIAEWASSQIPLPLLQTVFVLLASITLGSVSKTLFQIIREYRKLNEILASAIPHPCREEILLSDAIFSPLAAKSRFILVPASLSLTDKELDAVIAHERDHLRWKDSYLRLFYTLVSAFFWWIPMKPWLKRLEEDQEEACDRKARFPADLAEAILKTTLLMKQETKTVCCLAAKPHASLRRVQTILGEAREETSWAPCLVGAVLGLFIALSCVM